MQANADGWSVANAVNYSAKLVNETYPAKLNEQISAIRDFLSLYALTQADGQAGLSGKVLNTTAAKLFGGLISKVHIGGQTYTDSHGVVHNQNPYPSINAILKKLGIDSSPVQDHQHHFHVYFAPPAAQDLPNHLMADMAGANSAEAADNVSLQSLLDYALTLFKGDEIMFTMDVPYVPAQETPIVLVQAATLGAGVTQPDYILNACKETESTGDLRSAMRAINPVGMLVTYLINKENRHIDVATEATIKPTLLQGTQHGNLVAGTSTSGRTVYRYDVEPNYTGDDQAIFLAEFEGKIYKVIVKLVVTPTVGESPLEEGEEPVCPPPQLIKVNGKPVSGLTSYDLNSMPVTFADLTGSALGQTVGSTITLDTNAAGYNWFIDTTPGLNEEFLPTSNPNEWVAKAGSAAAGKMDMLSVLLHEYGHALGINHSADPNNNRGQTTIILAWKSWFRHLLFGRQITSTKKPDGLSARRRNRPYCSG